MLYYEISKKAAQACGSLEKAIAAGAYSIWNPERIRLAFHFGHGTEKDFILYMKNNAQFCYFIGPVTFELLNGGK